MATTWYENPPADPVEVLQCDGTQPNRQEIYDWVSQTHTPYANNDQNPPEKGVTILEDGLIGIMQDRTVHRVYPTDYVIKHPEDVFQVMYFEHFERDYQEANP